MGIIYFSFRALSLVAVCRAFAKCRQPLMTAAKSSVTGIAGMLLVNLVSSYTGCYIAVNTATVFVCSVFSLPGVIGLLILKLIYNY